MATEKQFVEMVYARFEEKMAYVSCEVLEKGHLVETTNDMVVFMQHLL